MKKWLLRSICKPRLPVLYERVTICAIIGVGVLINAICLVKEMGIIKS